MADLIGTGRCPIGCGSTKARYTLSAKKLAVGTCNACNCQVFARSDRSDEILRANIIADTPPAAEPEPPAGDPAVPGPTPVPEPTPKRKHGWGVMAGREID